MPKTALRGFELLIDKVCDNNKAVLTTTYIYMGGVCGLIKYILIV